MLRDVAFDRVTHFRACGDKERELGLQMVAVITEELDKAARQGLLVPDEEAVRQRFGPAVRNMSMELADRSERMAQADSLPIDDGWGSSLAGEEVEVGIAVTRWLRDRLPPQGVQREDLYMQVIQGLRAQLTQECRHLRRLHMALENIYMMGIGTGESVSQGEPEDSQMPQDARDLVDQIIMTVGQQPAPQRQTILDILRGTSTSSSSTGESARHGPGLFHECEALRRWLNNVLRRLSQALYADDHTHGGCDEGHDVTDEVEMTQPDEDAQDEGDEGALVQRPPRENKDKGKGHRDDSRDRRTDTQRRARSRSREQMTWSSASASGWQRTGARPTERDDGNDHRPWRRMSVGRGTSGTAPAEERAREPDLAMGLLGPQAWHCLLDMRSPLESPTTWGYGLSPASRGNIESSFATMSRRERQIMSMELLRVLSAILADIAQAITNALDQGGDGETAFEEDEDHSLVQALSGEKAARLLGASATRDVTDLLGSPFDKLTRALMAAMERMTAAESRRCGQALVNKLVAKYGVSAPAQLPPDVECLLSGFITFGADFAGDAEELNAMDRYFVEHWWKLVETTLPAAQMGHGAVPGDAAVAGDSSTSSSAGVTMATGRPTTCAATSATCLPTTRSLTVDSGSGSLGGRGTGPDGSESALQGGQPDHEAPEGVRDAHQAVKRKDWHLGRSPTARIEC